jgi:hypothetical protein
MEGNGPFSIKKNDQGDRSWVEKRVRRDYSFEVPAVPASTSWNRVAFEGKR